MRGTGVVLCVNAASALSVLLLRWLLQEGITSRQLASGFITSLTYANCCGTLMALVMPRAAPHFTRQPFPLRWAFFLGTLFLLSVLGSSLAVLILAQIGVFPRPPFWNYYRSSLVIAFAISLAIGVSKYLYEGLKHRLEITTRELQLKELEEERARKLAVEARLSSLESRIHPHFLFNTLNSISALIQEDPVLAERLVERLAGLLRFSLDSNQMGTVPLERELKIAADYLEIERARFGDRLSYSIDVPADLGAVPVPPLCMQTLLENSVKHAVAVKREPTEIRVTARPEGSRVSIEVSDNGEGFRSDAIASGHGLDNLQGRLAALFDDPGALEVTVSEGRCRVTIFVPRGATTVTAAEGLATV